MRCLSPLQTIIIATSALAAPCIAETAAPSVSYARHCANCHGSEMQGGSAGGFLDGKWEFVTSDADLFKVIKDGVADAGMPGFGPLFSDEEITAIVAYIRQLEAARGVPAAEQN